MTLIDFGVGKRQRQTQMRMVKNKNGSTAEDARVAEKNLGILVEKARFLISV